MGESNTKQRPVSARCAKENLDFERTFVWYDYFSCPQKDRLPWDMGKNIAANTTEIQENTMGFVGMEWVTTLIHNVLELWGCE